MWCRCGSGGDEDGGGDDHGDVVMQELEQQLQELDDQHMVEDGSIHQITVKSVYPSHFLLVGQKVLKKEVEARVLN
ncbi:hypothetical protein Tco_0759445 [Tanacetum coccineum]